MTSFTLLIGQNKWLTADLVGRLPRSGSLYQVTKVHRCNEVKVGDMLSETNVGYVAYSDVDATRPRYRFPSSVVMTLNPYGEEEE